MIDWNDIENIHIARRHTCPVCGKQHYIGRDTEREAWDCVVHTPQHLWIAQCKYCGGLIEVRAKEDDSSRTD